jgi:hypothetical protein
MLFHGSCEGGARLLFQSHILCFLVLNRVVVLSRLAHGVLFLYRVLVDMCGIHHEFSIVSEGLIGMLLVRVLPLS